MQIAVYSGSFDPLHEGHLAILSCLNRSYDKVLLVVSPQNPFKGEAKADNAGLRLEQAEKSYPRGRILTGWRYATWSSPQCSPVHIQDARHLEEDVSVRLSYSYNGSG